MAIKYCGRERMGVCAQVSTASHIIGVPLRIHRGLPLIGIRPVPLLYIRPWARSDKKPLMTSHSDRLHIGCIFVVRMPYSFIFMSGTDPPTLCLRTYDRTIPCDTRRILIPLHHPFLASSATHKLLLQTLWSSFCPYLDPREGDNRQSEYEAPLFVTGEVHHRS